MSISMAVCYCNFAGALVGEDRGGTASNYLSDPLGSCIGTTNSSGTSISTSDYWPYGELASSSGANSSPWSFVGLLGYFKDTTIRMYVRARHFRADYGTWMSVDALWPTESAYGYANCQPQLVTDPLGTVCTGSASAVLCCIACLAKCVPSSFLYPICLITCLGGCVVRKPTPVPDFKKCRRLWGDDIDDCTTCCNDPTNGFTNAVLSGCITCCTDASTCGMMA
jgi:RHS repeat-associated protein